MGEASGLLPYGNTPLFLLLGIGQHLIFMQLRFESLPAEPWQWVVSIDLTVLLCYTLPYGREIGDSAQPQPQPQQNTHGIGLI